MRRKKNEKNTVVFWKRLGFVFLHSLKHGGGI